jgi:plasmid stabilization system protein ParE
MMRLRWTVPAADDLDSIKNYLQQHFPHFAEPTVRTIYERIQSLKATPHRGRPGHRTGTRELPLAPLPYVVVYSVKAQAGSRERGNSGTRYLLPTRDITTEDSIAVL